MNVEIGAEAALFPEKDYINWDFRCSVEQAARVPALSVKNNKFFPSLLCKRIRGFKLGFQN